jgi:hypothetical protein
MADTSEIDAAIMKLLGSDATLLALMPNGVYWDVATDQMTRFVVVSQITHDDAHTFNRRSWEDLLYAVKAVGLSTTNPDMKAAAARIDALLHGATLTAPGYTTMLVVRESRDPRGTETDDVDPKIKWYHRGGHYRVLMSCD